MHTYIQINGREHTHYALWEQGRHQGQEDQTKAGHLPQKKEFAGTCTLLASHTMKLIA